MRYPAIIKENETIGICAPSAGIGHKLEDHVKSVACLKEHGYNVIETKSVRIDNYVSASAKQRGKEFNELIHNKDVKVIACATGGDIMMEMLPYIDFESLNENPKWVMGYSDPTNVLFPLTTMYDIASLYGKNGSAFVNGVKADENFLKILSGKKVKQKSGKYFTLFDNPEKHPIQWIGKKEMHIEGRCIGGCLEVIGKLIGTKFDKTNEFIERYKKDGIVWYFDIFNLDPLYVYLTLLQFKNAGWFKYCKGILFGRVAFESEYILNYHQVIDKACGSIPHIMEMDIGHTDPAMTMINGAIIKANYKDGKGDISFELR